MAAKMKKCSKHIKDHPVTDFPKDKKQHDGLSTWCKLAWKQYRDMKASGKQAGVKVHSKASTKKAVTKKASVKKTAAKSKVASAQALAEAN